MFDKSGASAMHNTILSTKVSYFKETFQNGVETPNDAECRSKSVSMESLDCISDDSEVSYSFTRSLRTLIFNSSGPGGGGGGGG